ncbi:MAG: enoyl-CoA hydratase/isomerase family protein [Saprospirales bacterium]|nr:MAG: enoyl-CoA hydratase/isomerase family protein [Saprospirales bacterium]
MSQAAKEAYVKMRIDQSVAIIEFYHPSHNSLPGDILAKLADSISEAGRMEEVSVILLRSGGDRTFCAGASFDEMISIEDGVMGKRFFMGFANVINSIRSCGKLVIGRVQGKAVGGGVGLIAAADFCFATKYSALRLSELAVGIGPFVIGPAVSRKTGLAVFSKMSLTPNHWEDPQRAKEIGLYSSVHESAEEMDAAITTFLDELRAYNPEALNELKRVFWEGTENWGELLETRATISGQLILSDFSKRMMSEFKAARKNN